MVIRALLTKKGRGILQRKPRLYYCFLQLNGLAYLAGKVQSMVVKVYYIKAQVLQALRYHFIKRPEIRLMIILVNVFALISAALFAIRLISALPFLMGTTLWLILMVSFWFWMPWLIYRRSRTFQDQFKARIESGHFFIDFGHREKAWAWREFSHYFESPHFFHLYFDTRSFFLLPKGGFESAEDLSQARSLFRERLGKDE